MMFQYSTLAGLKSLAKQIQAEQSVPRHDALDLAACAGGFQGYVDAKRKLPSRSMLHNVTVRQNWWGYETREMGTAQIDLKLRVPLTELVRRHHLTGYLGACKVEDSVFLERTGQQRHANETQWYIGRIARALQFMAATGLKPSSARRCYPTQEYDSRPPVADHDHCWFDPDARVHILSTEPYPGRSERGEPGQIEWERRHGWSTMYVDWGSIYGNGTEFILCCPAAYAEVLSAKVKILECSPPAVEDEAVVIETFDPAARKVVIFD
jgi:hypothetical protein